MKFLITSMLMVFSLSSFAQVPVCNQEYSVVPCQLSKAEATVAVIDMMLVNKDGLALINKTGEFGLTLDFFEEENEVVKVTLMSEAEEGDMYKSVMKYEVLLNDCRGIDTCMGHYKWTTLETAEGDGYSSSSTYVNTLDKL